jgi:SpoVK/Ycf46/Vps4 family AAA+-type ATPase
MMKCYELVLNHDSYLQSNEDESVPSFETLLDEIAGECEGFSGASLAGVARAAASHALERAVTGFSDASNREERGSGKSMLDCLVTKDDLQLAVQDVVGSSGESDWAEDEPASETSDEENTEEPEVESS